MKKTIKSEVRSYQDQLREQAMLITGFTDEEMNRLMFDFAVEYMLGRKMTEDWLALWLREPLFWNWWRQQWALVDEVFWYNYQNLIGKPGMRDNLRNLYRDMHLSIDVFPDEIIYDKIHDTYNDACQQIMHEIMEKESRQV